MLDFRVETFLAVCETMNFTRAAERLHITQPAVSQHIHALETQYGTRLFVYEGKQLRLTESGQLFLQTAATMHHDVCRLQEALRQMDARRHLRFGATLSIGEYILPGPLLRLLTEDPALQLRMHTANTQELFHLMDQGELDFAIVEGNFDQQVYEGLVYCTQRFIPVAAPAYSQDFRYLTELGSLNLIKSLVCAGAGISFFYQPVVQAELDRGELVELHLEEGDIRHDFTFLWRRGSAFAPYYREMFRLLRQP